MGVRDYKACTAGKGDFYFCLDPLKTKECLFFCSLMEGAFVYNFKLMCNIKLQNQKLTIVYYSLHMMLPPVAFLAKSG